MTISIVNCTEAEERICHQQVAERLKQAYREMRANVESGHAEIMQIKQQLQDQVRDLDHVDKANQRQAADMASRVGEFSVEQQTRLERLINSPYFTRVDVQSTDQPQGSSVYIGVHAFNEASDHQVIHDWWAPISSMFYDFELGDGYYDAPDGRIDAQILVYIRKSYRSTFQITQLAQSILNNPDLEPIERHGEKPTFNAFRSRSQELAFIAKQVCAFQGVS